jgi:hypothetical protein
MARIFISYARRDAAEIADELADQLRALEHEVFLDVQSIRAGSRWRSELSRRIKWSDLMVVLVTPGSNESDYVYQEVIEAEQGSKTIIPIRIGDTPLPVHLRGTWQAITFEDGNFHAILLEIQSAMLHSSKPRVGLSMILAGIVAVVAIIVILAIVLLGGNGNDGDIGETPETAIVIGDTDDVTPEITNIPADTPTSTPEPPTATNTDVPTPTNTPTITLTRTPRPPTNTPTLIPTSTDIPAEAVLYEENFEDTTSIRTVPIGGTWRVTQDEDGNSIYLGGSDAQDSVFSIGTSAWSNYILELRFMPYDSIGSRDQFEVCVRCSGAMSRGYNLKFGDTRLGHVFWERNHDAFLGEAYGINLLQNEWNTLRIEVDGNTLRVSINNIWISDVFDAVLTNGGIYILISDGLSIAIDDIRVWSLDVDD